MLTSIFPVRTKSAPGNKESHEECGGINKMKVLITGGAGFIGSEMVRQLADTSHDVYVLDALTYAGNFAAI